jgi:PAS domain S-box-containing protein
MRHHDDLAMPNRLDQTRVGKRHPAQRRPTTGSRKKPAPSASRRARHLPELQALEAHQLELEAQNRTVSEALLALEESRARYAALYDHAPVGQLTLDRLGVVKELNLASAALLQKERRSIVGTALRSFLVPESRRALDAHIKKALSGRQPGRVELGIARPDGSPRTVELLSLAQGQGGPGALEATPIVYAAMIDRSERERDDRQRERVLSDERQARLVAETSDQVKRDFLRIVSHELRSPLAPMLLWVRALRSGSMSDALRARAVEALELCIDLQVKMIDDLIDIARGGGVEPRAAAAGSARGRQDRRRGPGPIRGQETDRPHRRDG